MSIYLRSLGELVVSAVWALTGRERPGGRPGVGPESEENHMTKDVEAPAAEGEARVAPTPETAGDEAARWDGLVDEMSRQSFPSSDPPSTWAGVDDAGR